MSDVIDIVQDALERIGEYSPGETITAADSFRCLDRFNKMLASWSNQDLSCFAFLSQSFVLINNQRDYTIGPLPSADIVGPRPLKLEQAYLQDSNGNKYNVRIDTLYDFNLISNGQITSQIPSDIYYDPQVPLGILKVWPTPAQPLYTLYWTSYLQFTEYNNLSDEVILPNGYKGALADNLAVDICPYFNKAVTPDLRKSAQDSLGWLKRTNQIAQVSYGDPAIVSVAYGGFNIRSNTWQGRNGA